LWLVCSSGAGEGGDEGKKSKKKKQKKKSAATDSKGPGAEDAAEAPAAEAKPVGHLLTTLDDNL
jgi:hypothetical protein